MIDGTSTSFDLVLVGGGLQNALIALAVLRQSERRVCLIERDARVGGNHTWCFHAQDVTSKSGELCALLTEKSWDGYSVHFPGHSRELASRYSMLSSQHLNELLKSVFAGAPGSRIELGAEATTISATSVELADGRVIHGRAVIDARGPDSWTHEPQTSGYQKFVGLEVRCRNHGLERPILMDARVEQIDGFRFLYVLPLAADRLLIEDTRFSDDSQLDIDELTEGVHSYARSCAFDLAEVLRVEKGVLPLPWSGSVPGHQTGSALRAGYGGGWFHPVTGYSFPVALRLAEYVAGADIESLVNEGLDPLLGEHRRQMRFAYRLNRMLFTWFAPSARYNVLERFYKLNEDLIHRFYAMQTTTLDRTRVLVGRPPRGMSYGAAILGRKVS